MGGHRVSHHLEALGRVVDASATTALEVALPWRALEDLRVLLRADLVVLEGVDLARESSYFSQVLAHDLEVFTTAVDPDAAARFWRLVQQVDRPQARLPTGSLRLVPGVELTPSGRRGLHGHLTDLLADPSRRPAVLLASIPDGFARELRLLCVRRGRSCFDERDDLDLRLLLPHLERAYRRGDQHRAARCVTARQAMLLELVREGFTNAQVATRLHVSEATVRTHLNNIYLRLGVRSRTEAVSRLFGTQAARAAPAVLAAGPRTS